MIGLNGQYLALFMAALLFILLTDREHPKEFPGFCMLTLLLLLTPASLLLIRYQTGFYGRENIWRLLPLTALTAYGGVLTTDKLSAKLLHPEGRVVWLKGRKSLCGALSVMIVAALLFLCGTCLPGRTITEERHSATGLPQEAAVLEKLDIPEDGLVSLLAPDEVSAWARIYSGRLLLPYGRNLYEPELSAFLYDTYDEEMELLHDWINGSLKQPEDEKEALSQQREFLDFCGDQKYTYLIFSEERCDEVLKQALAEQEYYREETDTQLPYRIFTLQ